MKLVPLALLAALEADRRRPRAHRRAHPATSSSRLGPSLQ